MGDVYGRAVLTVAPPAARPYVLALGMMIIEADDRADTGPEALRHQRLEEWIAGFYAALECGHSPDPVLHAAADAARTVWSSPPRELFEEMFSAVRRDIAFTEFATYEEFQAWSRGSTVGPMRVFLMASTLVGTGAAEYVCEYGELGQLADNLADLSEDLANGRLYLPLEDLERFGVDRADLFAGRWSTAVGELIAFEAARLVDGLPELAARIARHPGAAPYGAWLEAVLRLYHDAVLDAGASVLRHKATPPPGALIEAGLHVRRLAVAC